MQNHLVYTKQCEIDNRQYIFEVYKGMPFRMGHHDFNGTKHHGIVDIKAFQLVIKEVTTINGSQQINTHDCGYCTSRTGEFKTAIADMMKLCTNMFEMKMFMLSLEDRFRIAMNRDAARALKVRLGLYNQKPANIRSALQQLPQTTKE